MKKFSLLICLIILAGCSKSEVILPLDDLSSPASGVAVSHLDNDDLVLVDGLIRLKISREEAIKRGVPVNEYDLVERTIDQHNETNAPLTKAVNRQILAWGMLRDPSGEGLQNMVSGLNASSTYGGIVLNYTFGSDLTHYCTLYYDLYGSESISDYVAGMGMTQGSIPFTDFSWGYINLSFVSWSGEPNVCVYEIQE
ncbi:MAG: hypothetical protein J6S66_03585 [Bacteroidales bacterium]|nr:hypothetical protein [Bacteroidales bacterium]